MCWSFVRDVWYAVTQVKPGTILQRQLMSTDLQISNSTGKYGCH